MRITLTVNKRMPADSFKRIEPEVIKRLSSHFNDLTVRVRPGENNQLDILEKNKTRKEKAQEILEEMFDDADTWLYG